MIAAVTMSVGTDEPKPATISSANILPGIAVSVFSVRLKLPIQRLLAAASNASGVPVPPGQQRRDEGHAHRVAGAFDHAGQHVAARGRVPGQWAALIGANTAPPPAAPLRDSSAGPAQRSTRLGGCRT